MSPTPRPAPIPGPRPGPQRLPAARPAAGAASGVPAPVDPELAESVRTRVAETLAAVDEITAQTGADFDLVALARQTQLLEQAHAVLIAALAAVDRR
ncbi:MAG: hypothetical protein QM662_15670 [Gordonia sp. (in: high G+C Gram-positive bacteria)]